MGEPIGPFVIEVELPGGSQTVVSLSSAKDAVAALQQTAVEYPDSVVMLYVNGRPVMVHGPLKH
jgi:hypothetical protein